MRPRGAITHKSVTISWRVGMNDLKDDRETSTTRGISPCSNVYPLYLLAFRHYSRCASLHYFPRWVERLVAGWLRRSESNRLSSAYETDELPLLHSRSQNSFRINTMQSGHYFTCGAKTARPNPLGSKPPSAPRLPIGDTHAWHTLC